MLTTSSPSMPDFTLEGMKFPAFDQKIVLNEALESFIARQESPETARAYRREVNGFLDLSGRKATTIEELQTIELSVQCEDLFRYLQKALKRDPVTKTPLNPNTWNRRKYVLQSFYHFLRRFHGYHGLNPAEYIDELPKKSKSNTTFLSKEEIVAILHHLKARAAGESGTRDYLLVLCMLVFCLRRKEAASIRWSQIDEIEAKITTTQKGLREKVNPIDRKLLELLLQFRSEYGFHGDYLFRPQRDRRSKLPHKHVSGEFVYQLVKSTAKTVLPGKTGVSPHSFRASFISHGLDMTDDLTRLMNASGHSTVEMLLYYDLRSKLRVNFSNEMAEWLRKEKLL